MKKIVKVNLLDLEGNRIPSTVTTKDNKFSISLHNKEKKEVNGKLQILYSDGTEEITDTIIHQVLNAKYVKPEIQGPKTKRVTKPFNTEDVFVWDTMPDTFSPKENLAYEIEEVYITNNFKGRIHKTKVKHTIEHSNMRQNLTDDIYAIRYKVKDVKDQNSAYSELTEYISCDIGLMIDSDTKFAIEDESILGI